jgi:hypothetical protein
LFSKVAVLAYTPCMRIPFSPHHPQNLLSLVFLMVAILTGVRRNLIVFAIVSIFSCVFWPFELLPLKKFCLGQLPTSLLVHWFWGSLVFWAHYIFWLSEPFWCIASKDFLPVCGWSLQLKDHLFCYAEAFNFM